MPTQQTPQCTYLQSYTSLQQHKCQCSTSTKGVWDQAHQAAKEERGDV